MEFDNGWDSIDDKGPQDKDVTPVKVKHTRGRLIDTGRLDEVLMREDGAVEQKSKYSLSQMFTWTRGLLS